MTATIHHGDCLVVLRAMPDNSVDAVVCDPPYGLSNTSPDKVTEAIVRWAQGDREYVPAGKGFMGASWDAFVPPVAVWDECLRVLKPGGHLVAFAGSRTQDLMGLSIRLAGFDIRENLAWLYGSGFPKSMDVSKAIDKADNARHEAALAITVPMAEAMQAKGLSRRELNLATGRGDNGAGSAQSWTTVVADGAHKPRVPTVEQWEILRDTLDLQHLDDKVWCLNGRKGEPGENWDKRAVVGKSAHSANRSAVGWLGAMEKPEGERLITAAATPEAEKWQGWGTAMKPSHEPVVWATKPLDIPGLLAGIGSHLDALELVCRRNVNCAAKSSAPTPAASSEAKTVSAPESAATPHEGESVKLTSIGAAEDSSARTDTSASALMDETFSSTVTSWRDSWAETCELMSMSTTSTTTAQTTDLKTLLSSLSKITDAYTGPSKANTEQLRLLASAVDSLFSVTVHSLRSTLALSAIENATESTQPRRQGEAGQGGRNEPIILARKPFPSTVASNVLQHGTGALNIDATRIGAKQGDPPFMYSAKAPKKERPVYVNDEGKTIQHQTVKPVKIMSWLVKLVTPPGGTVLDPFAGSGTTVEAAITNGFNVIGIEREAAYLPLIQQRIDRANDTLPMAS